MSQSPNRRRLAVIGAGVGVATAGVITLLVVKGEPEEEIARGPDRPVFVPPQMPKALPNDAVAMGTAPKGTTASTTPSAKDKAQADDDAKAKADADAKAKADAKAIADARKAAADQRRVAGILGSSALKQGGAFASLTSTGDISSGFDDNTVYGGLRGTEPGTGWGTIGTGRYGTIGRGGSGYGAGGGRGGMRGRSSAVPTISIGQPSVVPLVANAANPGELDKAIVRRYLKRNIQKLQYCYEKELLAKPGLAGTVSSQFTITESGSVGASNASGMDPTVARCVAGVIKGIEFPKPKGEGGVGVSYPFTFRPAGQ